VVTGELLSVLLPGLVPVLWLDRAHGGYLEKLDCPWLFGLVGGVNPVTVWSMFTVALASGVLLALGLGGRVPALVALPCYLAVSTLTPLAPAGDAPLLPTPLGLLVLARSTAPLSLDCRLKTGRWVSDVPVPAWPRYLVIFQLVLVYWSTGVQKVGADWTPA